MEKQKIFTFWEPETAMPDYIKLCFETWNKYLPEYEIIKLNYSNLDEYIGKNYFDKILYKKFSLAKQADAIRCAVLKKYGGIWLDADTIITSPDVKNLLNIKSDFVLIDNHIGFIKANKNSYILEKWEKKLHKRLFEFRYYRYIAKIINRKYYKKQKDWDYLGNGIISKYLSIQDKDIFYKIDKNEIKATPEYNYYKDSDLSSYDCYRKFYFENNFIEYVINNNSGIIMLHNSWTPEYYKNLSKQEFLEKNNTLSEIFKYAIYK